MRKKFLIKNYTLFRPTLRSNLILYCYICGRRTQKNEVKHLFVTIITCYLNFVCSQVITNHQIINLLSQIKCCYDAFFMKLKGYRLHIEYTKNLNRCPISTHKGYFGKLAKWIHVDNT